MPALVVRLQIHDEITWWHAFAENAVARRANGAGDDAFVGSPGVPGELCIVLPWDSLFRARLFIESDEWALTLFQGGVVDSPDYDYLESIPIPPE